MNRQPVNRQPGTALGRYAIDRSARGRSKGGRLGSSSGSKRSGSSATGGLLGSTKSGRSITRSPSRRLKPSGPVVKTRPGRRPGSGYGYGSRRGSGGASNGWGNSYDRGYYGGRRYWDYLYGYHYPWYYHRPYHYGYWGAYWGYYSWPRYVYSWPYWGASYPVYSSSTIYVYADSGVDDGYTDAGYYDPISEPIPVAGGSGSDIRPVDKKPAPDDAERGGEDLTLARHYSSLGDLYMRTRRYTRAWDSYQRAVKLAPMDGSLRFVLADALFQLGKTDECAYQIRKGLVLDPELASVEVDKRTFFDWPEDFDAELVKLEKKVAAEPFQANLRLVLAYNYHMTKRYADASRELTTLSEQLPGDETIQLMLKGLEGLPASK